MGQTEAARCDFRGNQLPVVQKNWYLLLRTPSVGPETGLYWGTYRQLTEICVPGKKLPQQGYGYRKVETEEAALQEWHAQGHRRLIPCFSL